MKEFLSGEHVVVHIAYKTLNVFCPLIGGIREQKNKYQNCPKQTGKCPLVTHKKNSKRMYF